MERFSIGVDLGGTNLRAAVLSEGGKILDQSKAPTSPEKGREYVITEIVEAIQELRDRQKSGEFAGVGIGVPGFIRMKEGVIANSNNLSFLENIPLRDEIAKRLGRPVILENDANAAAMGEKWMGAGRDVDDLVLLTLGTGIGGGIINDGQILHGFLGMAGELGHITVVPNGLPCGCGNIGCMEKHASASGIVAMAKLLHVTDDPTAEDVFNEAKAGNWKALRVFECMGEALGIGLATLVNTFNYPLYLLSGGPLPAWEYFAPTMFETVKKRSFTFRTTETRIEKATLGNQAGLYGAAYLPFAIKG
jgi:glucokinase